MLAAAQSTGERFLDVTAKALSKTVNGSASGTKGRRVCCHLMRRMMIPGDHELSASYGRSWATLLIRYRLPR
jgi:hypothetical protein